MNLKDFKKGSVKYYYYKRSKDLIKIVIPYTINCEEVDKYFPALTYIKSTIESDLKEYGIKIIDMYEKSSHDLFLISDRILTSLFIVAEFTKSLKSNRKFTLLDDGESPEITHVNVTR